MSRIFWKSASVEIWWQQEHCWIIDVLNSCAWHIKLLKFQQSCFIPGWLYIVMTTTRRSSLCQISRKSCMTFLHLLWWSVDFKWWTTSLSNKVPLFIVDALFIKQRWGNQGQFGGHHIYLMIFIFNDIYWILWYILNLMIDMRQLYIIYKI